MKTRFLVSLLLITGSWAFAQNADDALIDDTNTVVDFHIPAGTGENPWNTLAHPVVVHIGQTLRLHNDDDIDHWLHTPGAPCIHGTESFGPGETYDCVIIKAHRAAAGDVYDHNIGPQSQFYVEAN